MKKLLLFGAICLMLSGCAGTSLKVEQPLAKGNNEKYIYEIVDKAGVPANAMDIIRQRLDSGLTKYKLSASSPNAPTRKIKIVFNDYFMRHGAARALTGVMSGTDNIHSQVIISDLGSGKILGRLNVHSKNPTALGSARGLLEEHADKIVNYLKNG